MGTRTELELEEAQARVATLEAKAAEEAAVLSATTPPVLALAVELHKELCRADHSLQSCGWYAEDPVAADDPLGADWTATFHSEWLGRARVGILCQVRLHFTVILPGASEPLTGPPP